jgi:hypothetical protein
MLWLIYYHQTPSLTNITINATELSNISCNAYSDLPNTARKSAENIRYSQIIIITGFMPNSIHSGVTQAILKNPSIRTPDLVCLPPAIQAISRPQSLHSFQVYLPLPTPPFTAQIYLQTSFHPDTILSFNMSEPPHHIILKHTQYQVCLSTPH